MQYKWLKLSAATLAATSLFLSNGLAPSAFTVEAASSTTLSGQVVNLNASSYINVRDAHLLTQTSGKVLAFSVAITNNGASSLTMMDYFLRVKSKSGKVFTASVIEADKAKKTVSPKSTQYITYYAVLDNNTNINDIQFDIIKWDFSAANYERKLGTISYPAGVSERTAANKSFMMFYNNNKLTGIVKSASVTKDAANGYMTISFQLENSSQQAIDLSQLKLYVRTEDQSVYNVTTSDMTNVTIQPKEQKVLTLSARVPVSIVGKALSLVVAQNDDASKVVLPTGLFALPYNVSGTTATNSTAVMSYKGNEIKGTVKQSYVTKDAANGYLTINYLLENSSQQAIDLSQLKLAVRTSSQSTYNITTDLTGVIVQSKESKVLTLKTNIPLAVVGKSLSLVVSQNDEVSKTLLPMGVFSLPYTQPGQTADSSAQAMFYNGGELKGIIKPSYVAKDATYGYMTINLSLENSGQQAVDLSQLKLFVKTASQSSYNVTTPDMTGISLQPKEKKDFTLHARVPVAVVGKPLSLLIAQNDEATKSVLPSGLLTLPYNVAAKITAFSAGTINYNDSEIKGAVKQSYVTTDASNAFLTVNFLFENTGQAVADLSKMNLTMQTDNGTAYTVTSTELATLSLQPNERKIVTLRAKLPTAVVGKPVSLVISQLEEATKLMFPIRSFALPTTKPEAMVAAGKERMVYINGVPVNTSAGEVNLSPGAANSNDIALDFKLTNTGSISVANPSLNYYLVTKSGTSYPLDFTKEENATLLPNIDKKVSLAGSIPTSVALDGAQLVVKTVATDTEPAYVLGNFAIKQSTVQQSGSSSFVYNRDYTIRLSSINRSPLSDTDVLVANLSVTNNSTSSQPVPELAGYFLVNGVKVGTEQTAVQLDDSVTIAPGATYHMVVYTTVPYTTSISKVSFVSTEPAKDKASKQLYQFTGQTISAAPVKNATAPYTISSIGKRATVTLNRSLVLKGDINDTFYAELAVVNNETRAAAIAALGGYIVDKSGRMVPITVSEAKQKISSNGKALLTVWAPITKNFDMSSYKLVIGEAVNQNAGTDTGAGTVPNGTGGTNTAAANEPIIINPISYSLQETDKQTTETSFKDITFAGYSLSLSKLNAFLKVTGAYTADGLSITGNYTLSKDPQYEYIAGNHKLLIEFVNKDSLAATYKKQFTIGTAAGDNEELLKEAAKSTPITMNFADPEIQSKLNKYEDYTMNIYDVFQNTKVLLASKDLKWFEDSE